MHVGLSTDGFAQVRGVLDAEIVRPAEARFAELLARKAGDPRVKTFGVKGCTGGQTT